MNPLKPSIRFWKIQRTNITDMDRKQMTTRSFLVILRRFDTYWHSPWQSPQLKHKEETLSHLTHKIILKNQGLTSTGNRALSFTILCYSVT
jgi:hypothetical protein